MPGLQGAPGQMTHEPMPESQMTQEEMPQEVHLSVNHSVAAAMRVAAGTNLTSGLLSFLIYVPLYIYVYFLFSGFMFVVLCILFLYAFGYQRSGIRSGSFPDTPWAP